MRTEVSQAFGKFARCILVSKEDIRYDDTKCWYVALALIYKTLHCSVIWGVEFRVCRGKKLPRKGVIGIVDHLISV